jgi:uncharacterized integral membrane protein
MDTEPDPGQIPPAEAKPAEPGPTQPEPTQPEPAEPPAPSPPPPAEEPHAAFRPRFYAKLLALLFVVGYSIAFIVGNDKTISIDFVFATARVSLIWTILLLLVVGLLGGALVSQLHRHRRSKKRSKS